MSVEFEHLPRRKYVVRDFFGNLMSMYGTDFSQGTVVRRGPLLYAYPIPTKREEDTAVHANLNGKKPGNPDFKCWTMTPAGDFNFALAGESAKVLDDGTIEVPVKRIDWKLVDNRFTPDIPAAPKPLSDKIEPLKLIPYGDTCLRLTVFPSFAP